MPGKWQRRYPDSVPVDWLKSRQQPNQVSNPHLSCCNSDTLYNSSITLQNDMKLGSSSEGKSADSEETESAAAASSEEVTFCHPYHRIYHFEIQLSLQ